MSSYLKYLLFVFILQNITLEGTGKFVTGISVILKDVTLFTSGLYGCEASAHPSFHTELVRKRMTVLGKFVEIYKQPYCFDDLSMENPVFSQVFSCVSTSKSISSDRVLSFLSCFHVNINLQR